MYLRESKKDGELAGSHIHAEMSWLESQAPRASGVTVSEGSDSAILTSQRSLLT